jgi:hypothetical protein
MGMKTRPARRLIGRSVACLFAVAVLAGGCGQSEEERALAEAEEACLVAGWSWSPADLWLTAEEPDPCVNPNAPWPEPVSTTVVPVASTTTVPMVVTTTTVAPVGPSDSERERAERAARRADPPDPFPELPEAVVVSPSGLIYVPWLDHGAVYPAPHTGDDWDDDVADVAWDAVVAQRSGWAATVPFTVEAQARIDAGEKLSIPIGGGSTGFEALLDRGVVDFEVRYRDNGDPYEVADLCPQPPEPGDPLWYAFDPTGQEIWSLQRRWAYLPSLLVFSPGEPREVATFSYTAMTDRGWLPGDWSTPVRELMVEQAATATMIDYLVSVAAMSGGPATLWEACVDVALTSGTKNHYLDSVFRKHLEDGWSVGVRTVFDAPPAPGVYVHAISPSGYATAVRCTKPGEVFIADAVTGEYLRTHNPGGEGSTGHILSFEEHAATRVLSSSGFDGACDAESRTGAGFDAAVAWVEDYQATKFANNDYTDQWTWAQRPGDIWLPVETFVPVTQAEAWYRHRQGNWWPAARCRHTIPTGEIIDGEFISPQLERLCTPAEWEALEAAALAAAPVTPEMSRMTVDATTGEVRQRTFTEIMGYSWDPDAYVGLDPPDGPPRLPQPPAGS